MQNGILQKNDAFPKTVGIMCQVLAGWKHKYSNKHNQFSDTNDRTAFAITGAS